MSIFESLEGRRLYSVVLTGSTLFVTGTPADDTVFVFQQDPSTIRVDDNGTTRLFADSAVDQVIVDAGAGDDDVRAFSIAALPLTERMTILGGIGNDLLRGGDGNDIIAGGAGDDLLFGLGGQDILDGGEGDNFLFGGNGADAMFAGSGSDAFDGGAGTDEVNYVTRADGVSISLDGVANDGRPPQIVGNFPNIALVPGEGDNVLENVEWVAGGSGDDTILAGTANVANRFRGGAGNDRLEGRAGNDTLLGEDGNDVLTGGSGSDQMFGGNGDDLFFADDFFPDAEINGGDGFDTADRDFFDPLGTSIERLL